MTRASALLPAAAILGLWGLSGCASNSDGSTGMSASSGSTTAVGSSGPTASSSTSGTSSAGATGTTGTASSTGAVGTTGAAGTASATGTGGTTGTTGAASWGSPTATVTVTLSPVSAINPQIYGINYQWNQITAANFPAWVDALELGVYPTLGRYPSGWNAEHYEWGQNQEVAFSAGGGNCYDPTGATCNDSTPGADPATFLAALPGDFVTPSAAFDKDGGAAVLAAITSLSSELVTQYGNQVQIWEIGNEPWNQGSAASIESNYAKLVAAVAPAMKQAAAAASASIRIYASVDWQNPSEAGDLQRIVVDAGGASAWAAVDGITIHPYCGYGSDGGPACTTLPAVTAQIESLSGKNDIFASEWSVTKAGTPDDTGLENANVTVLAFGQIAQSGISAAAYWPGDDFVVGEALVGGETNGFPPTATGLTYGWLSQSFEGQLLATGGTLPSVAALDADGGVAVIIPSGDVGSQTVAIPLSGTGLQRVLSAEVLYALDAGSTSAQIATLDYGLVHDSDAGLLLEFEVNPGTPGRGQSSEIVRLLLAP